MRSTKNNIVLAVIAAAAALAGCGTPRSTIVRPESLKRPDPLTCLEMPAGVESRVKSGGLREFHVIRRLAQGPYISELEDVEGTYYRGPLGGIYFDTADAEGKPVMKMQNRQSGGLWIPRTPGKTPHLYIYITDQESTFVPPPEGASCATAVAVPDPSIKGVNTAAYVVGGALGGAAAGAVVKSTIKPSSMSYNRAVGAGVVGGAIGAGIVAALANMDNGKIVHFPVGGDPKFDAVLEGVTSKIVQIPPLPASSPSIQ